MRFVTHRPRSVTLVGAIIAASTAGVAGAQAKNWNAGVGNWGTAANWSPVGLPGLASQVSLGNTVAAENAFVTLNIDSWIASLSITDGMVLNTTTSQLIVTGETAVSGKNVGDMVSYPSRMQVKDGPAATDVALADLEVTDEARIELWGGTLQVSGQLVIGDTAAVSGDGLLRLTGDGPLALRVDGYLGSGMPLLTVSQEGLGRIDLDGSLAGDSAISVAGGMGDGSDFDRLRIVGDALFDAMDDDIQIGGGNELTMDLAQGWTFGANATMVVFDGSFDLPARLKGEHVEFLGTLDLLGSDAHLRIEAPITFGPGAFLDLNDDDLVECTSSVTLDGGAAFIGEGGSLAFLGDTLIHEMSIETFSADLGDGGVRFHGDTIYDGTLTIDGAGQQNSDATVLGPTVIDASRFDLDGADGLTSWSIGNVLVVTAGTIDTAGWTFNGSIDISGTFLGKLTLILPNPNQFWIMDGSMSLGGVAAIMTTRLDGNPVLVGGSLDVANRVRVDCPMRFESGSTVTFASPSSRLRSTEYADVWDGASFSGGQLESGPDATLRLFQGASLGTTNLLTEGDLDLGSDDEPVLAFASNVTMTPTSRFLVDIGGPAPGFEHDQLQASGSVAIAGTLEIGLTDLGNGFFEPSLGATYTILTAPLGGRSGAFANQPVSFVPGKAYVWSVGYGSNRFSDTVSVKVVDIIPCPADLNGDGQVDGADLAILLGSWGPCPDCNADFDLSGMVDGADLAVLLGAWGSCV
jgi:hypothetical protein